MDKQTNTGDSICHTCGAENPAWYAENELFNKINGSPNGVYCPLCFQKMADKAGLNIIFKVESIMEQTKAKTAEEYYPGIEYQELFNLMSNEHGLTLLQSEMDEIVSVCSLMGNKQRIKELENTVGIQDAAIEIISDSVANLEAQNKELREALEKIQQFDSPNQTDLNSANNAIWELTEIAIKALKEDKP